MEKLKIDDTDTLQDRDRLSKLPDRLILHILSFLNTRYVVRTTLLSKRWQHLWTTIPYLDFTEYEKSPVKTRDFINGALNLWKGTRIRRFKIDLGGCDQFRNTLYGDMDLWVRFVTGRNVEELCLHSGNNLFQLYSPPQYLYSCSSITKLSLFGCFLRIHGVVHWDQLKSLTIHVFSVTEDVINQVLSGAPRLEIFDLSIYSQWKIGENLSIRSSSLKRLSICKKLGEYDPSKRAVLTIWAPNLEELVLSGASYSKCLMMDVSSLRHVSLDFNEVDGETMRQILPTFKHVKVVTLSSRCFKVLRAMKGKFSFSPLSDVDILRFNCDLIEPKEIVGLLEIFPKLKMLAFNWTIGSLPNQNIGETLTAEEDMILIKSLFMQLRTVKIGCPLVYEKSTFEFVEFFLKHATVLEKMVIQKIYRVVESEDTQKLCVLRSIHFIAGVGNDAVSRELDMPDNWAEFLAIARARGRSSSSEKPSYDEEPVKMSSGDVMTESCSKFGDIPPTDDSEPCDSADCKMKKLKSLDRLSELSDSLILEILSFLEMRDVVQTTLLSKRWKGLWTSIPCLCFENDVVTDDEEEIRNFINRALLLWKGGRIQKFEIRFCADFHESLYRDMNVWLHFVTERKVDKLYLRFPCDESHDLRLTIDPLPHCLYECSSITELSLVGGCNLHIRGDLEIFQLSINSYNNGSLTIRSSSLKKLSIRKTLYSIMKFDQSTDAVLTIWTPNLETLVISGAAYGKCLLMDVSSLTDATLDFEDSWNVVLGETLRQILPTFQHVEKLTLSSLCFKYQMLGVMKGKYSFSPLLNVKLLRVTCDLIISNRIVGLLEIFPELKMLDIYQRRVRKIRRVMKPGEPLNSEVNAIKSFMMQLRIVEIGWYKYDKSIFEFIEFFLEHAAVLEKMVIQNRGGKNVGSDAMILAAEKLQSLQKSFPTVELVFCKNSW
ncbi:hypothetical protein C2S51_021442 [Perilla frutescens var. frutescens]|nr:hypothetical protein C2S51_021442 [Perilla frutescens var. frutescens]